jgi:tRNA G18 (ribose-2'-O)-methylase SpoU
VLIVQGPNVKKLIAHKMSLIMISPGCGNGLATAIEALTKPGNLGAVAREATTWVEAAIAAVKAAPDNPYGDDEAIASEILHQIELRKKPPCPGSANGR